MRIFCRERIFRRWRCKTPGSSSSISRRADLANPQLAGRAVSPDRASRMRNASLLRRSTVQAREIASGRFARAYRKERRSHYNLAIVQMDTSRRTSPRKHWGGRSRCSAGCEEFPWSPSISMNWLVAIIVASSKGETRCRSRVTQRAIDLLQPLTSVATNKAHPHRHRIDLAVASAIWACPFVRTDAAWAK